MKEILSKKQEVNAIVTKFNEDGAYPIPKDPMGRDFTSRVILLAKEKADPSTAGQWQEYCIKILENVISGKPDNILVDFLKGHQRCQGKVYNLGDTVVKMRIMDESEPVYFYLRRGDTPNFIVFIGGDNAWAFLAIRDTKGDITYVRLSEFHLLSLSENSKPGEVVGLISSYVWLNAKIFSDIIIGMNLEPVINLLMMEKLQMEEAEKQKEREKKKTMEDNEVERKER